jgi:hypothetical protein
VAEVTDDAPGFGIDRTAGCGCGCQDEDDQHYSACCREPLMSENEPCPACKRCNQCGVFITDEAAFCKRGCCGDKLRAFCSPECFTDWHAPDNKEF